MNFTKVKILNNIFVKDFEFNKFLNKFVEFKDIVLEMKQYLKNDFKYYLVDLIIKDYKIGESTCSDTRYHLDGDYKKDNQYCIYCEGPNRTLFSDEKIDFSNFPESRDDQNNVLESMLKDKPFYEIEDKKFIIYDSKTPHKGVVCKQNGLRKFIRLMGTNYIKPKNYIKL